MIGVTLPDSTVPLTATTTGEHYVQGQGLDSPEVAVESAMSALLEAKLPRQTEGLISMGMVSSDAESQ